MKPDTSGPAYPHNINHDNERNRMLDQYSGLTKREIYAMAALQGIGVWTPGEIPMGVNARAIYAVAQADALLAALERKP